MTIPRWIPLLATALLLAVACIVIGLRLTGNMRNAQDDAPGRGPSVACDPPGHDKPPRPADCPQNAPPTQRSP